MKNALKKWRFDVASTSRTERRRRRLYDPATRKSPQFAKVRKALKLRKQRIYYNGKYCAFPYVILMGASIVGVFSEGDAHGDSDRTIMFRSDDLGKTFRFVTFYENLTAVYDYSLIDDLMSVGDHVTFRTKTVRKDALGGHTVFTNSVFNAPGTTLPASGQYDSATWTKSGNLAFGSGSIADTTETTDPSGTNTAEKFVWTSDTSARTIQQTVAGAAANVERQWYVDFKMETSGASLVSMYMFDGGATGNYCQSIFSLSTVTVSNKLQVGNGLIYDANIRSLGNGWYRCSMRGKPNTSNVGGVTFLWRPVNGSSGSANYTSDGVHGLYVSGGYYTSDGMPQQIAMWGPVRNIGGTLYSTGYSTQGDTDLRTYLLKSVDAGETFTVEGLVSGASGLQLSESDIVQLGDGTYAAFTREFQNPTRPIYKTTAATIGGTWSAPVLHSATGTQPYVFRSTAGKILLSTGDRTGFSGFGSSGAYDWNASTDRTGCLLATFNDDDSGYSEYNLALTYSTDGGQPFTLEISSDQFLTFCYLRETVDQEPGIYAIWHRAA